ncbi:hypothetical protein D3C86_1653130 [compost metagenome]
MELVTLHQHFRHQQARIIRAGLHRAIGAGGADGDEIARLRCGHLAVQRQVVTRLADGTDDIGLDARGIQRRLHHRANAVIGFVKRGADEIVHRAVDDHEGLFAAILHIDYFRHQNAGIADNQASRFGDDLAVEALQFILDDMCIGIRQRRRVVVVAVGNAETAADVDMTDRVSVGAQRLDQFAQ